MRPDNRKGPNRPCRRCGAKPPQAAFSLRTVNGRSYRHSWCLDCQRALNRSYKRQQRADAVTELGPLFGSHHPNAKLTESDVVLIWDLIKSGLSDQAIAEKFEVASDRKSTRLNSSH